MMDTSYQSRKRPVDPTLNEAPVARAKTSNLTATTESLLADSVASQKQGQASRQDMANA